MLKTYTRTGVVKLRRSCHRLFQGEPFSLPGGPFPLPEGLFRRFFAAWPVYLFFKALFSYLGSKNVSPSQPYNKKSVSEGLLFATFVFSLILGRFLLDVCWFLMVSKIEKCNSHWQGRYETHFAKKYDFRAPVNSPSRNWMISTPFLIQKNN